MNCPTTIRQNPQLLTLPVLPLTALHLARRRRNLSVEAVIPGRPWLLQFLSSCCYHQKFLLPPHHWHPSTSKWLTTICPSLISTTTVRLVVHPRQITINKLPPVLLLLLTLWRSCHCLLTPPSQGIMAFEVIHCLAYRSLLSLLLTYFSPMFNFFLLCLLLCLRDGTGRTRLLTVEAGLPHSVLQCFAWYISYFFP